MTLVLESAPESRSEETRSRIFIATQKLVKAEGAQSLTIRRIAQEASVSPALIIQYFKSKDRLMRQVYETNNHDICSWMSEAEANVENETSNSLFAGATRALLTRDFENPELTLFVRGTSYLWSKEDEENALGPIYNFMKRFSNLMQLADMTDNEDESWHAASTFLLVYHAGIRHIFKKDMSFEEGLEFLMPRVDLIRRGLMGEP